GPRDDHPQCVKSFGELRGDGTTAEADIAEMLEVLGTEVRVPEQAVDEGGARRAAEMLLRDRGEYGPSIPPIEEVEILPLKRRLEQAGLEPRHVGHGRCRERRESGVRV